MSIFGEMVTHWGKKCYPYMTDEIWRSGWKDQVKFKYQLVLTDGKEFFCESTFFPHYYLRLWADELRLLEDDESKIVLSITKYPETKPISETEYRDIKESIWKIGSFIPLHRLEEFCRETWNRPMLKPIVETNKRITRSQKKIKASVMSAGELMMEMVKPDYPLNKVIDYQWFGKKNLEQKN